MEEKLEKWLDVAVIIEQRENEIYDAFIAEMTDWTSYMNEKIARKYSVK